MKLTLVGAVVVTLLRPCVAAPLTVDEQKILAWSNCVSDAGKRLAARSREPVATVITAAFGSCATEEMLVHFAWGDGSMPGMRQAITDRVTREIVESRSNRPSR